MRADYINREGKYSEGTKAEELLFKKNGNMPEWVKDNPRFFWEQSELLEASKGWTSFREIEFALPNELNLEQQKELVAEFVEKHFGNKFVYTYAIHEKSAALAYGVQNPHVHIMFSERRLDGITRDPYSFFKRADNKQPERGGAPKDARWNGKGRNGYLLFMREDCALLQNKYLERFGFDERVDHRQKEEIFFDAIKNGDLNKAELLEAPAERHLGPKIATRVSRDLRTLTAGISDPKERARVRADYWKSREDANELKVSLLRESRILKSIISARNDKRFLQQSTYRSEHAQVIAENMFWKAKAVELQRMKARLNIEKYRLERAEQNLNTDKKVAAWRSYYEKRVDVFDMLSHKLENRDLTSEDKSEIALIKQSIINVESNKTLQQKQFSIEEVINNIYPGVSKNQMRNIAESRIDEINSMLIELRQEEKALQKRLRSNEQIKIIAEWRASKGVLSSISRDDKMLTIQKQQYKIAIKDFISKHAVPPTSSDVWKYNLELSRLHEWEDANRALNNAIKSRRIGWNIQKYEDPSVIKTIKSIVGSFEERNKVVKERLKLIYDNRQALYHERSEWRKLGYSLNKPEQNGRFLQQSREVYNQFQKAVRNFRDARPKGGLQARIFSPDDDNKKALFPNSKVYEIE